MKLLRRLQGSEFAFFLFLAILNAVGIAGPFLWTGRLYHDTLRSYSFFYDNLDSLHRFGEPAWWASAVSHGMPNYFFGLLGIPNLGKPAFVLMDPSPGSWDASESRSLRSMRSTLSTSPY